jgi:hypothetical protein
VALMPIYLDEDMVGQDPAEICYPHLLLCMGVTVLMTDGTLIGAHFTTPDTEADIAAEMVQQINAHGHAMHQLYCSGSLPEHVVKFGGAGIQGKAQLLGFHGDAYSFDSSSIDPQDGTFVAVRSNGPNHKCSIYYKRDEKVKTLYQPGNGTNVSKIVPASRLRAAQVLNVPSAKTGLTGPVHKLHKASFLLRIDHYSIP